MEWPRIFLGSTKEEVRFIKYAEQHLPRFGLKPIPWTSNFLGGEFSLESLNTIVQNTDGAIFFMTPSEFAKVQGKEVWLPRDNLILEAGMFIAAHGRKRVALIVPSKESKEESEKLKAVLPSDLAGLTYDGLVCKEGKDLAETELLNVLERASEMIKKPRQQFSDFGLSYQPTKLHKFLPDDRLQLAHALVGPWDQFGAIASLMQDSEANEIDILIAYRVIDVFRSMKRFRSNPAAKLRLCMADMMDRQLNRIYRRKYIDRDEQYLEKAVCDSIQTVLLGDSDPEEAKKIELTDLACSSEHRRREVKIGDLVDPPKAQYEIYLCSQRVTFSYYRIDDIAFIIPLDMKLAKGPAPYVWTISKERNPRLFNYYLHTEYDAVIESATKVYPKE